VSLGDYVTGQFHKRFMIKILGDGLFFYDLN